MPSKVKRCVEKLLAYMASYKIQNLINCFNKQSDRDLFESEFVRYVWDKPDLTPEEQGLYMLVCSNQVRAKHIQKRLDRFNEMLASQEGEDVTVTMAAGNYLKSMSEELNACEKRISDLITKLNGDRSKRLEKQNSGMANILSLVEAFQEKEERDKIIRLAEMQNSLVEDAAREFESMEEQKARLMGISIEEMI